jgi:hypothetical protein
MVDEAYFVEDDESGGNQFRMIIYRMTDEKHSPLEDMSSPAMDEGDSHE